MPSSQIDKHRYKFLRAVECIPEAHAKFKRLARDAENLRGVAFNSLIEKWAIECHLAIRPAKDWWIFDHVAGWLSRLDTDPPDFGTPECSEDLPTLEEPDHEGEIKQWRQELIEEYYSYTSVGDFVSLPQELPFRLYAYDPAFSTLSEYEAQMRTSFKTYFDNYLSRQPAVQIPETRVGAHYEWLVRYQMLHHGFPEIAASPGVDYSIAPDSLKTTVFELRRFVSLPPTRGRGRPPKM
jgi:hypothetical protein